MIRELLYALDCDTCGARLGTSDNQFRLMDLARDAGWMLRRRKDGQYAATAGRDRCPACVPASWGDNVPEIDKHRAAVARSQAPAGDFHDTVCTGPGVPAGFTCSHPSHTAAGAR